MESLLDVNREHSALVDPPEPRSAQRVNAVPERAAPDAPGTSIGAAAWRAPPPGTRILLAEDDPVNQLVTSYMLADLGFEVDTADNGEEAVEKARAGGHALVLMDLNMPIMDGVEATRLIRRIPELRGLVILALTASVFEDDRKRCEQAGMNGHLAKPIDPVQMQAALSRWLRAQ